MEKLSIGQMAKLHNISERTLRVYHDMGLLAPQYIDPDTSYRYYVPTQSKRLEMILQMKAVGLSLKQIKYMLDSKDLHMFEAALLEQIDLVNAQITELRQQKEMLVKRVDSCKNFLNPPSMNNIYIEHQAKRVFYHFEIDAYDYEDNYRRELHCWERALEQVKQQLVRYGMPITYFGDVGAFIRQEDIIAGRMHCVGAIILAEETPLFAQVPRYEFKAGTYVCMYDRWQSGNSRAEVDGVRKLLEFIRQEELTICGDYIAEVIAESTVFDLDSHLSLIKMQIPVSLVADKTKGNGSGSSRRETPSQPSRFAYSRHSF